MLLTYSPAVWNSTRWNSTRWNSTVVSAVEFHTVEFHGFVSGFLDTASYSSWNVFILTVIQGIYHDNT